ncbi:MAG: hypothetical protein HON92_14065 [Planctomycetaceae bacterium]|jgi:predicted amidophosphoribosyltransferase|nr:hypothetical protein [Planctomycetaceae bacterium]MBT4726172.1 hypothetical protein [Planctomycetaceae bacterium]MBT4846550.1 hypothetical protein [Planctomycetaceae bacterium]MBT5125404.1 hypothetical protein [Planctomycetaceae bacterium]MBT5598534.1 hypothetical protein [Planctomycetaceae bacterium]
MKWLLIVLFVLTASFSGCKRHKTGYECFTCQEAVAYGARACVHCGQPFSMNSRPTNLNPPPVIEDGYDEFPIEEYPLNETNSTD